MIDRRLTLAVLACCTCLGSPGARATGETVTVTTARRVHSVLIRNDHNILLQIVVNVESGKAVRLKAMHFAFGRCDDVGDLASLALFATGDRQEFSPASQFGKSIAPVRTVAFRDDLVLRRGRNVFWLSGQLKPTTVLTHRIAAVCTSVETTEGKLPTKDLSPGIRQRVGIALRKHKDDGVHTYRIPSLATSAKGTLLCVYDMRRRMGRDLQEDIDIGLSRSTDGGITWEPVRVIMDMGKYGGLPEEQNGCSDPGIIVDQKTGEIFCFAVWMHGNPGKHQWSGDGSLPGYEIGKAAQMLMVRSRDDGRSWSRPENLTRKLKKREWWLFAPSPQQGINLADGTLVMPVQGRDEKGKEFSTIMTSRDHGVTWIVGTPAYSGGSECQAVQLGDGSIMLNMRNERGRFRAVFVTRDLGKSWQPHETNCKTLIEPNCNGSLLRVDYSDAGAKKHVLLFTNPHSQKGRTHQTIQVSFDDGRTWPETHHLLLDEGRGAGYPSLTRIDDRHVGIVYEGSQAHLVFEKIPLAELLKPAAASAHKRRVLYNFDGDSCLSTKAGGKGPVAVNVDDVKRLIEEVVYDGSRVDTVLVCVNAQVTYYPTKVGTMRGALSSAEERAKWPVSEKQRFKNVQAFLEKGIDPYAIMLAEAKRRGREALLSFRMNDDHGDDFLRTQFLVDHPNWRLGTERYRGKGAMDFGRDEVRDYTFRLIEEAVRHYDCDGIELDFNRFPRFFKDGPTTEHVAKMNSLVERVRKMLDDIEHQRGRRLVLAVRVPSNFGRTPPTPETARQIGCDVPAWVRHGWVDFVTVSEFLFERGDLPIGLWRKAITTVPVYGGIECTKGSGRKNLSADEYRRAGMELIKAGADGIYLFNFFTSRERSENAYEPPFEVFRDLGCSAAKP